MTASQPEVAQPDSLLLRVPEVARLLSVSRNFAYEMTQTGELPCVYMGKSVRVSRAALLTFLDGLPKSRVSGSGDS